MNNAYSTCRIFTTPEGGTVSLVCLEVDRQLVHVFTYDQQAAKYFKEPINITSGFHAKSVVGGGGRGLYPRLSVSEVGFAGQCNNPNGKPPH